MMFTCIYPQRSFAMPIGALVSFAGHVALFAVLLNVHHQDTTARTKRVIYSVSLESGSIRGGITQVGKGPDKQTKVPPKAASVAPEKLEDASENEVVEEAVKPKKVEPVKPKSVATPVPVKQPEVTDAEVSLAKKAAVPTPKPTPRPTAKPKPTPKPTAAPTPKPTPTPAPEPTAKKSESKKSEPKKKVASKKSVTSKKTASKKQPSKKPAKKSSSKVSQAARVDNSFAAAMQRYSGNSVNAGGKGFGSTGAGGRGMGGGVVRPPEWILYKNRVESTVKRGFNWHDRSRDLVVLIRFSISRSGKVSNVKVVEGSGNYSYDLAANRAVQKASPLPPPPAKFYEDFAVVEMELRPN